MPSPTHHPAVPPEVDPGAAHSTDEPAAAEGLNRRGFLATAGAVSAVVLLEVEAQGAAVTTAGVAKAVPPSPAAAPSAPGPGEIAVRLRVNQVERLINVDPRMTLLDALREKLQLAGAKKGCDHGQCGACTVLVQGRRSCSCLTLAVMHDGSDITTIEGLASGA